MAFIRATGRRCRGAVEQPGRVGQTAPIEVAYAASEHGHAALVNQRPRLFGKSGRSDGAGLPILSRSRNLGVEVTSLPADRSALGAGAGGERGGSAAAKVVATGVLPRSGSGRTLSDAASR